MSDPQEEEGVPPAVSPAAGHAGRSQPPRAIDYEDVDDIIGIAAELQQLDEDRLSVEELSEVARDLAIPDHYVAPAVAELRRRRADVVAREQAEASRRAARRKVAATVAAGVIAITLIAAWIGQRGLASSLEEAEATRAQVVNVRARQAETRRQWDPRPDGPDKRAELSGAENRVRVESKRYNDAAAAYNATARAFPGSLWAALFGLPSELPPAHELDGF